MRASFVACWQWVGSSIHAAHQHHPPHHAARLINRVTHALVRATSVLRGLLNGLLRWLLALLIVFEEWGWWPLARALGLLARLPMVHMLEQRISRLPPYAALVVFCLPTLLLVPVKLGALWLIGRGHAGLGLLLIVAAKVLGTAIVARLFMLTQPQLMQLAWFVRLYGRWQRLKEGLLAMVRSSPMWRSARAMKATLRRWLRRRQPGRMRRRDG